MVGIGDGETFVASAIPAFLAETREVLQVKNGEIVTVDRRRARRIIDATGRPVERDVEEVDWDEDAAEKGGYETFMLKEIHEQAGRRRRDDHRPPPRASTASTSPSSSSRTTSSTGCGGS